MLRAQRFFLAILLTAAVILTSLPAQGEEEYPLRPYYPEVPYINTDSLMDILESAIVVDTRSSFEYDVAHINKAELLPLADPDFAKKLERIRSKASLTPMAFYCNGHSSSKSYKAARLAISLGFSNVYVYDSGIFDWITKAPNHATLLGETPARADKIIFSVDFNKHQRSYQAFAKMGSDEGSIVIDIRDSFQREVNPRIPGIRNIPMDSLLEMITSRIWTEKRLLFFDDTGKQVRWLQYFLDSYGYYNYAFLKGGVQDLIDDESKIKPIVQTNRFIIADQEMFLGLASNSKLNNSDRKAVNYLIGNIKFGNYIVINLNEIPTDLKLSKKELLRSIAKLQQFKYVNHTVLQDNLIAQIDPRLAWKGKQDSEKWKTAFAEFNKLMSK